jgi:hypothetical protein
MPGPASVTEAPVKKCPPWAWYRAVLGVCRCSPMASTLLRFESVEDQS